MASSVLPNKYEVTRLPLLASPPCQGIIDELILVNETCPPGYQSGPQVMRELAFMYTRSGGGELTVNGKALRYSSGGIVVLGIGSTIQEVVDVPASWQVDYVLISGAWATFASELLMTQCGGALDLSPAPANLKSSMSALFESGLKQPHGWRWNIVSQCSQMLGAITAYGQIASGEASLVEQVDSYLAALPGQASSASEIARQLNLSPRQLEFRFRQATGEPLGQWLRRRRIEQATTLLNQGLSVSETATALGYANPFHFSRVFKKIVGISPSIYRQQSLTLLRSSKFEES